MIGHAKLTSRLITGALALGLWLGAANAVQAHCDIEDGPVVTEAKAVLESGDVTPLLKWVAAKDAEEIRKAFEETRVVRTKGDAAQKLADRYFFETVVRLHRADEGEPYTGVKPAGTPVDKAVRMADQALESGSEEALVEMLTEKVADGLKKRFKKTHEARQHADDSVEAGRQFVTAYVDFVHYALGVNQAASGVHAHGEPAHDGMAAHMAASTGHHEAEGDSEHADGPTAELLKEHDLTEKMIQAAAHEASNISDSGQVNTGRVRKMLDFFVNFVDACHHAKEERFYFPSALENDGTELALLVETLAKEHARGADLLSNLSAALDAYESGEQDAAGQIAGNLDAYAELIQAHIQQENAKLFPFVLTQLNESEKKHVSEGFAFIEEEELGAGFHEKYHALAMEVLGEH